MERLQQYGVSSIHLEKVQTALASQQPRNRAAAREYKIITLNMHTAVSICTIYHLRVRRPSCAQLSCKIKAVLGSRGSFLSPS